MIPSRASLPSGQLVPRSILPVSEGVRQIPAITSVEIAARFVLSVRVGLLEALFHWDLNFGEDTDIQIPFTRTAFEDEQ